MYIITIDGKPATVAQLFNHEGWTYDEPAKQDGVQSSSSYVAARTATLCRDAYESITCIAWSQKQRDVRTTHINTL